VALLRLDRDEEDQQPSRQPREPLAAETSCVVVPSSMQSSDHPEDDRRPNGR
jgi:hypothetical protein